MEFLRSFLRRHLAGKPVVASPNRGKAITFRNFLICHVEQYSANDSEVEMQICAFVDGSTHECNTLLLRCYQRSCDPSKFTLRNNDRF